MAMPTTEEIVSLYLFGQYPPPANLKTEDLIRQPGDGSTRSVDMNEYMTIGGGRFVKVENFAYVRNFLAHNDYDKTLTKNEYTPDELLAAYGKEGELGVQQYFLGMTDADYMDRAYVFGSGNFKIADSARFVIDPITGFRSVFNIAVEPVTDNFDYISGSWPAIITNWMTESRIDPSGIGRTVTIKFTGSNSDKKFYTEDDWLELEAKNALDAFGLLASKLKSPGEIPTFVDLMARLAASGVIDYKDSEGRFVNYDGASPTNNGFLLTRQYKD